MRQHLGETETKGTETRDHRESESMEGNGEKWRSSQRDLKEKTATGVLLCVGQSRDLQLKPNITLTFL